MSSDNTQTAEAADPTQDGGVEAGAGSGAEAAEPAAEAGEPAARIAALEGDLVAARREAEQARDAALRARAESDNVRKRAERDLENAHRYALERFVAELVPVKDSMEMGLAAEAADAAALREGTEMTLRMLAAAMEKFGVAEIDPQGEPFDPERHQAMSTCEAEGVEPGHVVQVVQKGYLLNDRVVRAAMVIVSR